MFVGRKNEIKEVSDFLNSPQGLMILYGKRRIGKTALIKEVFNLRKEKYFYFQCTKDTYESNTRAFVQELMLQGYIKEDISGNKLSDIFYILNYVCPNVNIVIDEYTYLFNSTSRNIVDSDLQKINDNYLLSRHLILTGSELSLMKDLEKENNPLFGRVKLKLSLKEFNYLEASEFYSNKTPYEKVAFYSVFGGSPFVNRLINKDLSLKENIINLCLNPNSEVYSYVTELLFSNLSDSYNVNRLLSYIKNGKKRNSEIERALNFEKNGGLNKKIKTLIDIELLTKNAPINKENDDKKVRYEIKDNIVKFFYTFVLSNVSSLNVISPENYYEIFIDSDNRLGNFLSKGFEQIVRQYIVIKAKEGVFKDVIKVGSYYYDDPKNKVNGEFDIAILKINQKYSIGEVKYYNNHKLSVLEMYNETEQIKRINEIEIDDIFFVSTLFEENNKYKCYSIEKLYE